MFIATYVNCKQVLTGREATDSVGLAEPRHQLRRAREIERCKRESVERGL